MADATQLGNTTRTSMFLFITFGPRNVAAVRKWQCVRTRAKLPRPLQYLLTLVAHHKRDLFIYRLVTYSTLEAT